MFISSFFHLVSSQLKAYSPTIARRECNAISRSECFAIAHRGCNAISPQHIQIFPYLILLYLPNHDNHALILEHVESPVHWHLDFFL